MLWHLGNPDAAASRGTLEAMGKPIPAWLWPPEPPAGYEGWLEAFWELGTERQIGMGLGPIPGSAIRAWCQDWPDARAFHMVIRRLDAAYLDWQRGDKKTVGRVSAQPMSEKLFDAVWGG